MKKIAKAIARIIYIARTTKCSKCKKGRVRYVGEDRLGRAWISVYQCDNCKETFI